MEKSEMFDNQVDLCSLGWDEFFQKGFLPYRARDFVPGRIAIENRGKYLVLTGRGTESWGTLSGKLRHESARRGDLPVSGDWVALRPRYGDCTATIVGVVPRKSQFIRGAAGVKTEGQIIAANIDTVFLVMALNSDFNLRRLERYLVMATQSGAQPAVVLSKSDLCSDPRQKMTQVAALTMGAPVHVVSVVNQTGLEELPFYVEPGKTIAMLGSSGVGKSTLINYLAGQEVQKTQDVRARDGRGKHTTTSRRLILLPGGGLVLDTPGLRELQLWDEPDLNEGPLPGTLPGIDQAFSDIASLANQCYFRNCSHDGEPNCAIQAALTGEIDPARFRSYQKLQKEIRYQERRRDKAAHTKEKTKWKKLCRMAREKAERKRGG